MSKWAKMRIQLIALHILIFKYHFSSDTPLIFSGHHKSQPHSQSMPPTKIHQSFCMEITPRIYLLEN